jgi:hypothetical protein
MKVGHAFGHACRVRTRRDAALRERRCRLAKGREQPGRARNTRRLAVSPSRERHSPKETDFAAVQGSSFHLNRTLSWSGDSVTLHDTLQAQARDARHRGRFGHAIESPYHYSLDGLAFRVFQCSFEDPVRVDSGLGDWRRTQEASSFSPREAGFPAVSSSRTAP